MSNENKKGRKSKETDYNNIFAVRLRELINATEKKQQEIADFKRTVKCDNSDYLTGYICALSAVEGMIAEQPAVEVVCCKDCKYWKQERYASSEVYMNCTRHDRGYGDAQPREAMDFCSYGKRKDNGNAAT